MWKALFYNRGKALGEDLRMKIMQDIIGKGGAFTTGLFMASFSTIAKEKRENFENVFFHCCSCLIHLKPVGKEFHQNV